LIAVVHDSAVALGVTSGGYNHEFHVFLPAGIDTCFPGDTVCYSPDNPTTFAFCAYHGSVVFSDIGHVMFSVEPYQNVPGCQAAPPNPNGMLADSTNSVLSHETIETITDPDGDAWIADNSLIAAGAEIGDLCEPTGNDNAQFLDSYVNLTASLRAATGIFQSLSRLRFKVSRSYCLVPQSPPRNRGRFNWCARHLP